MSENFKQRVTTGVVFLCLSAVLLGCSGVFKTSNAEDQIRIRQLERELRRLQAELSVQRERNLVLEQQRILSKQNTLSQTGFSPPANVSSGMTQESEGGLSVEQRLYSKVLESYRLHSFVESQKASELLLKTYPESIYADNALYLTGLLAFEKGDNAGSEGYMDRILRDYPSGNKVQAAMFAKAMIQKRTARLPEARINLRTIGTRYPGSPEAVRAGMELKLLDAPLTRRVE